MRSSDFVNHMYNYRPNRTPLVPSTIINKYHSNYRGQLDDFRVFVRGVVETSVVKHCTTEESFTVSIRFVYDTKNKKRMRIEIEQ